MRVMINGESRELPRSMSVADLLVHLELTSGPVAVELNHEIVPRSEHASRTVDDGATLEIVHMVGGG